MELFFTASFIAAFIAGIAALFAPCCISVLLPSYLASIFREKHKIFLMTFIFFLGILLVFLPIGLGAAAVGKFFNLYHNQIFILGGLFMLFLALSILSGKHFSLPWRVQPKLKNRNVVSVFSLGVFSGLATLCCAPVLAGLLSLSILPGSFFWGGLYSLSYALGMTAPLFFISLFLDRINLTQKFAVLRAPFKYQYPFINKTISLPVIDLFTGVIFLGLGILIMFLAFTNRLFMQSDYQLTVNIFLAKLLNSTLSVVKFIPEYIFAFLAVILFLVILRFSIKQFRAKGENQK